MANCPMCGYVWNEAKCSTCGWFEGKSPRYTEPRRSLCACVSDDAERCIALRYPDSPETDDDGEPERCECSCHDFARYDE
jgi:hypothetical protein